MHLDNHSIRKMELTKKYPDYYRAAGVPELVTIETAHYVSILGNGSPGTNIFYGKKAAIKKFVTALQQQVEGTEKAFENLVVEIFYWYDDKEAVVDIGNFYTTLPLDLLQYRIAIRIPENITAEDIKTITEEGCVDFSKDLERFSYTAGTCVQLLHSGPFAGELKTLPVLQKFATDNGWVKNGMHQEIHLTAFEKGQSQEHLQTILRDPVTKII